MAIPAGINRISETVWELPVSYKEGMRVPARIYGTEKLVREMDDAVYDQVTNVATLPGVTKYALCMPDGHFGYGFPIGGVAAMDVEKGGVISPGGIGFDINCGMRLIKTNLTEEDVKPRLKGLVDKLFDAVPAGVGATGFLKISRQEFRNVVEEGAQWCVRNGYGWNEDLELTEDQGCTPGAEAATISERAIDRGFNQIGTLGSGNHYLEVQVVREGSIFDHAAAEVFGLTPGQVVVMFHCGSRGFGHQVATDYLRLFLKVMESKYNIRILDRELACAPFDSPEGRDYFAAMKCCLNMSFANRQMILHRVRQVFADVFEQPAERLGIHMIYDIAHNTAKLEKHPVNGKERQLLVHRKGATRAFGPGMAGIPQKYRRIGQPVIIGGSMETGSYLLVGTETGKETFYSTPHGSGRTMSRTKARKQWRGKELQREMEQRGIYIRTASWSGLAEEAGGAYKNIDEVIEAAELAGICKRVVRFTPLGNIKG
ncbi:MAG: RNA-splicing ligase RtcB [Syntrophorhabdaceae bacterium PtaU1.Bin034]|nr:MAG: RNA-splicing ligase RtcB [Syntrophorhabdaceae bacterium PtaU1.Bin034]